MTRLAAVVLSVLLLTVGAFAGSTVATVSGSGTFELRGAAVDPQGVPSWPVMSGDVIATSATPVVVQFRDGSRVTLGEQSKAKVENSGESVSFRLLSGVMEFTLAKQASVKFFKTGATTPVAAGAGVPTTVSTQAGGVAPPAPAALRRPPPPVSSR